MPQVRKADLSYRNPAATTPYPLPACRSKVAGYAIHRGVVGPVALDAETHGVIDLTLGDGLRMHVAVALRAIDAGADVRGVIEFHMRGGLKAVNASPWDVLAAGLVDIQYLDFWLIRGHDLMAGHAEIDAGDARVRALINA